ncbi:hypothetical protein PFICI_14972 [Pestalotiopsis fici W106-1]|uniref:Carrier domain-containing protein n=1 Tax=Pestalotiopsis fici (strain W106-1 / CGMCC3.15140) TaxID=1229662 RepID=W3WJQ4_PESFW|nr:uncharacterized protein PFICI_14972 [Pestalotiopsis fici W106-1]ETS73367.1 hypothetical protein PFICI_14972 [Pestalotiopsis fici W106-1]
MEDVGYVADKAAWIAILTRGGQWTPLLEGNLRKILGYSILQQTGPINVARIAQFVTGIVYPLPDDSDLIREARFGYHFVRGAASSGAAAAESGTSEGTIRSFRMLQKSGAETAALVKEAVDILASQFTKILRLETEMGPAKSLMASGLDSLAAVELRNWVRSEVQGELTTLEITNASSFFALVGKLQSV